MKQHKATLLFFGSICALLIYISVVSPSLENPLTLAGFYMLCAVVVMSGLFRILSFLKKRTRRYLWAVSGTLYIVYIGTLGSLNAFSIANVSLATAVLLALLFMIDRS